MPVVPEHFPYEIDQQKERRLKDIIEPPVLLLSKVIGNAVLSRIFWSCSVIGNCLQCGFCHCFSKYCGYGGFLLVYFVFLLLLSQEPHCCLLKASHALFCTKFCNILLNGAKLHYVFQRKPFQQSSRTTACFAVLTPTLNVPHLPKMLTAYLQTARKRAHFSNLELKKQLLERNLSPNKRLAATKMKRLNSRQISNFFKSQILTA